MDLTSMIAELRAEIKRLDAAIAGVEALARAASKRRGRPPKWMTESAAIEVPEEAKRHSKERPDSK